LEHGARVGRQAHGGSWASLLWWAEREAGGPVRKKILFLFLFLFQNTAQKSLFLSNQKLFSQVDPKTKVVQNFILYNIAFGYILKFQLDFKIGI
jgi:hypothetical protein